MTRRANEVIRDQLIDDFNAVVGVTQELLQHVANSGGEQAGALRARVEQNLGQAKKRLLHFQQAATDKTQAAARATDAYVHESPWQAIGIAAGLVVVIAVVSELFLHRR